MPLDPLPFRTWPNLHDLVTGNLCIAAAASAHPRPCLPLLQAAPQAGVVREACGQGTAAAGRTGKTGYALRLREFASSALRTLSRPEVQGRVADSVITAAVFVVATVLLAGMKREEPRSRRR